MLKEAEPTQNWSRRYGSRHKVGTYLNPELGERVWPPHRRRWGHPDDLSARRELEVLRLIALGYTNGEIATRRVT